MLVELPTDDNAYPISTEVEVRMSDTSGGVHLGNFVMVSYMNEAMMKLYDAMGFKFGMINGVSFIQREMSVSFYAEASYSDKVRVFAAIETFEESRYTKIFRLYNETKQKEVAHLRAWFSSYDYKQRKKVSVPRELIEAYKELANG